MTQLSDEILIAYADGELGPAQTGVVDGVLASDPVTLEQFENIKSTNRRLSQAFSLMLQAQARQSVVDQAARTAQPARQQSVESKHRGARSILVPAIAASVVMIAVGAMGGYLAGNQSNGTPGSDDPFGTANFWNKDAVDAEKARSQMLFNGLKGPRTTAATNVPATSSAKHWYEEIAERHLRDASFLLDQYDGKSRNRELSLFQFSQSEFAPTMIPVLKEEELVFVGASPVQVGGGKYARLAYRDTGNGAVPVGLYVGRAKGGSLTLERGYRADDNYVRWTQGRRSYMLIGPVPHWRLIVLSVAVQRQLVR